jgi:hypothetical protein
MAMPAGLMAVVLAAVAVIIAVPSTRADMLDALHIRDAAADTVQPDGTVGGRPAMKVATQAAPPAPTLVARPVNVDVDGFFAWALMDRHTGRISGSANDDSATNTTESMIKIWITSDYLRMLGDQQPSQSRLAELSRMIRNSDDKAAEDIYLTDGGNSVIRRLIATCGLQHTSVYDGWWSWTNVTAADATRMGLCVADGRAAGPKWTPWVLNEMRHTQGSTAAADQPDGGHWGIIDGLPPDLAQTTAIKNGWTALVKDGNWHVNCLAVQSDWILAVLTRYPQSHGLQYGANICKSVTQQLLINADT